MGAAVCTYNRGTERRELCFAQAAVWTQANKYCNNSKERKSPLSGVITPMCTDKELIEKTEFKVDLGQILICTSMYCTYTL